MVQRPLRFALVLKIEITLQHENTPPPPKKNKVKKNRGTKKRSLEENGENDEFVSNHCAKSLRLVLRDVFVLFFTDGSILLDRCSGSSYSAAETQRAANCAIVAHGVYSQAQARLTKLHIHAGETEKFQRRAHLLVCLCFLQKRRGHLVFEK